ncbi:glycoside hydrolase family 2 TIM barrel-domain containing protein [Chloroflexota bacterium]
MIGDPFVLGVNYWPRRKAMYWWGDFDPGEVDEEFALIAELGLNVVRMFLLWDDFQPEPSDVSEEALSNLVVVADTAAKYNLGLDVTFFTGHMSGPNWAPGWLLGGQLPPKEWGRQVVSGGKVVMEGYRNMFHDPVALGAQKILIERVVKRLKDHSGIWMWNLGNEPDLFAWPDTFKDGRGWTREMRDLIRQIDPVHPVTCGLHGDSLYRDNGLRIDQIFAETDVAVMHSYSIYTDWLEDPLDPDFAAFSCALTAALCGKPVLMEEFGGCTAQPGEPTHTIEWDSLGRKRKQLMVSEEDLAEFIRLSLQRLVETGATGAIVWCFADYIPELWDKPPCVEARHERFFGLVRPDGSLKPHAKELQKFADRKPVIQAMPDYARFAVDPDDYYEFPLIKIKEFYEKFKTGTEGNK